MIRRVFLGNDEPAVTAGARALSKSDPLSLSQTLIIVPTRASSIKLNHELVRLSQHQAVILPVITTADKLIRQYLPASPAVASSSETLAAWSKVLMQITPDHYPALFGKLTVNRNFAWACACGEQFMRTQNALAEAGYTFQDFASRLSDPQFISHKGLADLLPPGEPARWKNLAKLESLVFAQLKKWNRIDHNQAILHFLRSPLPALAYKKAILLCHPDPLPLFLPLLEFWGQEENQVEVWIHAPEELSDGFDMYGRPVPDYWENNMIPLPEGNSCLKVSSDPATLAGEVIRHISRHKINSNEIALGICDPSFTPALEDAFARQGWKTFNAAGYKGTGGVWYRIIQQISTLIEDSGNLPAILELVSTPLIQDFLGMENPYDLLREIDKIKEEHLPEILDFMETLIPEHLRDDFIKVTAWAAEWQNSPFCKKMKDWLLSIRETPALDEYRTPSFDLAWDSILTVLPLEEEGHLSDNGETIRLTEHYFLSQNIYDDPIHTDLSLDNWLELPFTAEPHLILTAFHEGKVPENSVSDPFLPEKLRRKLNLRGTTHRLARDSFLLTELLHARKKEGSARIFLSKTDAKGNPCLPSSLLMRCRNDELPERVTHLFPEKVESRRLPANERGNWILTPSSEKTPWFPIDKAFSPSLFKDFLTCPFRFWLKHVKNFRRYELELSAKAHKLGTIMHKALEKLSGRELVESTDTGTISKVLTDAFNTEFQGTFGKTLSLPLSLQYELGKKRINAVARAHADNVKKGWRIIKTEQIVNKWELSPSYTLNMRIDCIMQNDQGDLRILDYKTSKKPKSPFEAHLKSIMEKKAARMNQLLPQLPLLESSVHERTNKDKRYRWKDLQLPLYALWAKSHYNTDNISTAYFNIPLNLDEVGISSWESLDEQTMESAAECARAIIDILRSQDLRLFPSAEKLGWETYLDDPFQTLGADGLEEAFNLSADHSPLA